MLGGFILKTKNTGYMKTLLTDRMKTHVLLLMESSQSEKDFKIIKLV